MKTRTEEAVFALFYETSQSAFALQIPKEITAIPGEREKKIHVHAMSLKLNGTQVFEIQF